MDDKEKVYDGVVPLNKAFDSVVMMGSGGKAPRARTIKEQTYNRLCKWMGKYSDRISVKENGKAEILGTPIFPTAEELRRDLDITWGQFKIVAKNNGDVGAVFSYRSNISEEQKKNLEKLGLTTGVNYVALESCYPFLKIFKK